MGYINSYEHLKGLFNRYGNDISKKASQEENIDFVASSLKNVKHGVRLAKQYGVDHIILLESEGKPIHRSNENVSYIHFGRYDKPLYGVFLTDGQDKSKIDELTRKNLISRPMDMEEYKRTTYSQSIKDYKSP
ncbi:MAG: hypothetical protein ACQEP1_02585 [Nanobdellota archaeon]